MDFNLLKKAVTNIEMPDDMSKRIVENVTNNKSATAIRVKRNYNKPLTAMCACLAAALIGLGLWKSGVFSVTENNDDNGLVLISENDNAVSSAAEIEKQPNLIRINQVEAFSGDRKLGGDLDINDFVKMNEEELEEYYGTKIFPQVPSDLKSWHDSGEYDYGIYKRNKGSGEVYYDLTVMNYSNEDFSKDLNIEIAKGKLPASDVAFWEENFAKSLINGTEVGIGQSSNGYFYAEFIYNNTGFRIISSGLSQEEIVSVIESLVS